MFGKKPVAVAEPVADPAPSVAASTAENQKESVVAPAMTVRGDVDFEGVMRIEGEVHGKITGQGCVTVDPSGKVLGDVVAAEVVVHGTIQGNVNAALRLEIAGTAQIAGDVKASQLVVARGAKILGRLDIDSESMAMPANGNGRAKSTETETADALAKVL